VYDYVFRQTYQYKEITFQMIVYHQHEETITRWPDPIEQGWQMRGLALSPRSPLAEELASKMPHLGLADILFLAAAVHTPARPYGVITWLADFYRISRVSVYKLGERVAARLQQPPAPVPLPAPAAEPVSKARIDRTILTALFPGNASIRPTRALLKEALDTLRSVGYISSLRLEAGQRAGCVLSDVNYASLGPVIALRDETFFQGRPMLLLVDPISTTIVAAHVCPDRQADTWALALLMAEEQGLSLIGLTEDMAKPYDKSLKLAGMAAQPQQKDIWHLQRDGATKRRALERAAYRAMSQVIDLEKELGKAWDDDLFADQYIPAVAKEQAAIACHDQFETWLNHLYDALALVDIRSGEIRDPATSQWFLEAVLTGLEQIEDKQVKKFVGTLRNHQPQLLTFLDWTAAALADFDSQLTATISDAEARRQFIQAVARSWLLDQMLINGHPQWRTEATKAAALVQSVTETDAALTGFAHSLRQILDASGRTSSLIESINSLLKSFFRNRKGFKNQETMQAFLNLFVLWHNMRVYDDRCKRGGKSPFQLAGIDLGTDDWLTLLGYLPAN
jgi:hypothetical protein